MRHKCDCKCGCDVEMDTPGLCSVCEVRSGRGDADHGEKGPEPESTLRARVAMLEGALMAHHEWWRLSQAGEAEGGSVAEAYEVSVLGEMTLAALSGSSAEWLEEVKREAVESSWAVSMSNEATAYPWWAIVRRVAFGRTEILVGPFCSRKSAEQHRVSREYEYGKQSFVFCFSGHRSNDYRLLLDSQKYSERLRAAAIREGKG